jgi:hypothetical protein
MLLSPIKISPLTVVGSSGVAPVNTVAPALSYTTLDINDVVTCDDGTWTGTTPITYTYQWYRDAAPIGGDTASSHTIVLADVGTTLKCVVTGTNAVGNSSVDSDTVAIVWTPLALGSKLLLWNDAEFVTKDASDFVSEFDDLAGTGYFFNNASAIQQPLQDSDANGIHVIFDGIDDRLNHQPNFDTRDQTVVYFIHTNPGNATDMFHFGDTNGGRCYMDTVSRYRLRIKNADGSFFTGVWQSDAALLQLNRMTIDTVNGQFRQIINDAATETTLTAVGGMFNNCGNDSSFGFAGLGSSYYDGKLYAVVMTNEILSAPEEFELRNYFNNRFSLGITP